jgi:hypothetical protein
MELLAGVMAARHLFARAVAMQGWSERTWQRGSATFEHSTDEHSLYEYPNQ